MFPTWKDFPPKKHKKVHDNKTSIILMFLGIKILKDFLEFPISSVSCKHTVTKWWFQYLEVNLQGCFYTHVLHMAWHTLASDVSHLLHWSVSGRWLWSQLVFGTSCCYKAYNRTLWFYKPLLTIFKLVWSTNKGMQAQNIHSNKIWNVRCSSCCMGNV